MSTPKLNAALAALQQELPRIRKSETAKVVTKEKGSYSYTYAGLADISEKVLPLLGKHGLAFLSLCTFDQNGRYVLECSLVHTSGEQRESLYVLPHGGTPQAIGSAITYGRRYMLCAMTGVAPDDDDDGAAAEAAAAQQPRTAQRAPARQDTSRKADETAKRRQSRAKDTTPAEETPPDDGPEMVTQGQQRKLHALFGEAKVTDRDTRLSVVSYIVGRRLSSARDLTKAEAGDLIDRLENAEDVAVAVADVLEFIDAGEAQTDELRQEEQHDAGYSVAQEGRLDT